MRKASPNPKAKKSLLDAAQSLVLTKGFEATSVEEICRKARLTKGSFFHYFKSKEDLAKTLLERFCCSSFEAMRSGCCRACQSGDPLERVYAHINLALENARAADGGQGCLLGVMAQELSDSRPEIRSLCEKGFKEWAGMFAKDLQAAKAKYAPKSGLRPESLAEHFIAVIEGSLILAKTKQDKKVMERNLMHFRDYIRSLFRR